MVENNRRASLDLFQGADGPTLMFLIHEEAGLSALRDLFLRLAKGEKGNLSVRDTGIAEFVSALDDLVLVRLQEAHEPSRTVRKVQDTPRGPRFEFLRYEEGWLECAELLHGLKAPGHQYLSRGSMDEALVMVSYRENLLKK